MTNDSVRISVSAEEARQFVQFAQKVQSALPGGQAGCQPVSRLITVDERCQYRWPLATPEHRRRIRDVCLARYREQVGRHPYKLTGHANGTFTIEEQYMAILDRAIDIVRNEAEAREKMPLFQRRIR